MPVPRANAKVEMKIAQPQLARRSLARSRPPLPAHAFTLIELLVVIAIVAVLASIAVPVFQGVQNQAKKAQARNDLTQIVIAVNAFYTEYGKYPVTGAADVMVGPGGTATNDALLNSLRGLDPVTNPRQIVFFSPPDAKDPAKPAGGIGRGDSQYYDPWGTPYAIAIDANYDNEITPNPYGDNHGAGPSPLRQGVIGWSLGKDTKLGRDGNNKFTRSDDVISWQ